MTIVDEALINLARQRLLGRAEALRAVTLGPTVERNFLLRELRQGEADAGVTTWLSGDIWPYPKAQPTLYVIRLADAAIAGQLVNGLPARAARDFAAPKENKGTEGSATLYVGSSEDVKKRLREHLWQAHPLTYALHLGRWCVETEETLSVSLQPILNGGDREVRQELEDTVWRQLTPRLGKPGGR
ncbi:MAG: hypothetical protein U1E69_14680 [Tabrizicola sp.]|uniref:hypothetical protein n=1 Tax=Tabrizicola sp. TaxID=2005166 RepID=UPI002ABADE23|nr:hypothetical protein [Tabrizicola sp.]MDZ4088033.1 hypothetical protein [Tabrizicola sp.]